MFLLTHSNHWQQHAMGFMNPPVSLVAEGAAPSAIRLRYLTTLRFTDLQFQFDLPRPIGRIHAKLHMAMKGRMRPKINSKETGAARHAVVSARDWVIMMVFSVDGYAMIFQAPSEVFLTKSGTILLVEVFIYNHVGGSNC